MSLASTADDRVETWEVYRLGISGGSKLERIITPHFILPLGRKFRIRVLASKFDNVLGSCYSVEESKTTRTAAFGSESLLLSHQNEMTITGTGL